MQNLIEEFSGPWLIHPPAMEELRLFAQTADVARLRRDAEEARRDVSTRNRSAVLGSGEDVDEEKREKYAEDFQFVGDSTAMVPIVGKIMPRASLMTTLSGSISVSRLTGLMRHLEASGDVGRVVMNVDSSGGQATGIPNLAQVIREMETPTVAFAQGRMLSAAYWIGSAADRVVVSPTGSVGSIGVVSVVASEAERLEDEGIQVEVVRSAPNKAPHHPAEQIDESTIQQIEERVNSLHREFVRQIATNRNLSIDTVRETMADGRVEEGREAAETEFADDVATVTELIQEEFELDENSSITETEQLNDFLQVQLDKRIEALADARETIKELRAENQEMRERMDEVRDMQQKVKVDEAIQRFIYDEKRVAPGREDELRERLEDDYEQTVNTIENFVEKGAARPDETPQTGREESTDLSKIQRAEKKIRASRDKWLVETEGQEDYMRNAGFSEGTDYFVADKLRSGSYDVSSLLDE